MRQIKFRAWIYDDSYMIKGCDFKNISFILSDLREKDFDLQQFTGLRDKKGTDIYEGDIIKATDYGTKEEFILSVDWFADKCSSGWSLSSIGYYTEELEVIGNIYQNPELINLTK